MEDIVEKIRYANEKVNDKSIKMALLDIQYLQNLIKEKIKQNPTLSPKDVLSSIENQYEEIVFNNVGKTFRNGNLEEVPNVTQSDFFFLKTISYLRKNPEKILETIDQTDRKSLLIKRDSFTYSSNMKNNIKEILNDVCSFMITPKISDRFISGELTYKERVDLQKSIITSISNYQKILEQNIRKSYTKHITQIAKLLDESNCLDKSIETHNKRLRLIGLDEFQEIENTKKGNKPQIRNMRDWKNVNAVSQLSLDSLIMASAFFANKACKEYISFKRAIFLLNELGISNEINNQQQIDESSIRAGLIKYEFIQNEARDEYMQLSSKEVSRKELLHGVQQITYELDYSSEDIQKYKELFDTILPNSNNNLIEDRQKFSAHNDVMEGLYKKKDHAINSLVISLLDKNTNCNWGYIPEESYGQNSIQKGKRMIEIGFDLEGFNLPIRLHVNLNNLRKIVKEYTGKSEIPVYQGDQDWTVESKYKTQVDITTQIFRPTTKEERKSIKDKTATLTENDTLYPFLTHLNWIENRVTPERYKQSFVVSLDDGTIFDLNQRLYED